MEWIIENWILVVVAISVLCMALTAVICFFKEDRNNKVEALKRWLEYAVVMAEKELGSGTGQLKLRYVYDLALKQFPWVQKLVSFEVFSAYVDNALEWFEKQLVSNKAIQNIVKEG